MKYPSTLLSLISILKKLPGVGSKTAERFAFQLFTWQDKELKEFASLLLSLKEKVTVCTECGCLSEENSCHFCNISERNKKSLCIVSSPKDVFMIEESRSFTGLYHVLSTLFSPIDGKMPDKKEIDKLKQRIKELEVEEVILALDATLEGDATSLFLKEELKSFPLKATRLAFGIPIGSSLEYVDGTTLARALTGRQSF